MEVHGNAPRKTHSYRSTAMMLMTRSHSLILMQTWCSTPVILCKSIKPCNL